MAQIDEDVFFSTLSELQDGIRKRKFSSRDLTRAWCDRIEKFGPRYNALALLMREEAIRKAHDADGDFMRDRVRSPLQGIPYAVKDLIAVSKHPTTWGAKPFAAQVFEDDATVVKRIAKGGGVLI